MNNKDCQNKIIDQIVIFGAINIQKLKYTQILKNQINVGVLFDYPKSQKQIDYGMWAFPDGIKIYDDSFKILNDPEPEFSLLSINLQTNKNPPDSIHSFVLTDYQLNRRYCTCLTFHEMKCIIDDRPESYKFRTHSKMMKSLLQYSPRYSGFQFPKSTLKQFNQTLQQKNQIIYVPKTIIVLSKISCFEFQRQFLLYLYFNLFSNSEQINNKLQLQVTEIQNFQELIHRHGYPLGQQKFDIVHKQPKIQKKPIVYRKRMRKAPTVMTHIIEKRKIDKKIFKQFFMSCLLLPKFNQSPTQIIQNNQVIAYLPIMKRQCFSPPNINILNCFETFGIQNIIILWKNVLLQRQILVFSSDLYQIIQLFQTLLYLIQPIKWENIYIPFLPFHLHNNVDAIGGYMIGMSRIHMDYMIENFNLKNKCLVNIDQMIVLEQTANNEIPLPIQIKNLLSNKVLQLIGQQSSKKLISSAVSSKSKKTLIKDHKNPLVIRLSLQIKSIFFDSLLLLFNNYLNFVQWSETDGVQIKAQEYINFMTIQGSFPRYNQQNHLQQNQLTLSHSNNSQTNEYQNNWPNFIKQMTRTMVFIRLAEFHWKTYKVLGWNQYSINELFVYCYNIIDTQINKKFGKQARMWRFPQNSYHHNYMNFIISNSLKKLNKGNQYILDHYAIKYLKYLQFKDAKVLKQKVISKKQQSWLQKIGRFLSPFSEQQGQSAQNQRRQINRQNNFKITRQLVDLQKVFEFLQYSDKLVQIVQGRQKMNNIKVTGFNAHNNNYKYMSSGFEDDSIGIIMNDRYDKDFIVDQQDEEDINEDDEQKGQRFKKIDKFKNISI